MKTSILLQLWKKFPQLYGNFRNPGLRGLRVFPCLVHQRLTLTVNLHVWLVQEYISIASMYCRLYRKLPIAVVATAWAGVDSAWLLAAISVL